VEHKAPMPDNPAITIQSQGPSGSSLHTIHPGANAVLV